MILDAHKIMLENYMFQNVHHKIIQKVENLFQKLLLVICHCCQKHVQDLKYFALMYLCNLHKLFLQTCLAFLVPNFHQLCVILTL